MSVACRKVWSLEHKAVKSKVIYRMLLCHRGSENLTAGKGFSFKIDRKANCPEHLHVLSPPCSTSCPDFWMISMSELYRDKAKRVRRL
jgi:hypothetical protein